MPIRTDHWGWKPSANECALIERALFGLGASQDNLQACADGIHDGVIAFRLFRPSHIQTPSPTNIKKSLNKVVDGVEAISEGLSELWMAWLSTDSSSPERLQTIEDLHRAILGALAVEGLPASLARRIPLDELADSMPSVAAPSYTNQWLQRWQASARQFRTLAAAFESSDLARTSRPVDDRLVLLIQHLGDIYTLATGKRPAAPAPKGNAAPDWQGPFVRFVADVWPLTGSPAPPTRNAISRALKAGRLNHPKTAQ